MNKKLLTALLTVTIANLHAADFKSNIKEGADFKWADPASWTLSGESKLGFPKTGDNVQIEAQEINSNYLISLNLPKDDKNTDIVLQNFIIDISDASTLFIQPEVHKLQIDGNFEKTTKTLDKDGVKVTSGKRGDFAIYPAYEICKADFILKGNLTTSDFATDRTSSTYIGGYTYFGSVRPESFFERLIIGGDVSITNQILSFGGRETLISGKINFCAPVNKRQAVLLLNADSNPQMKLKSCHLKVGGLQSMEDECGIVSTRTGMQKINDIDPLSKEGESASTNQLLGKIKLGDNSIREGTIEIVGSGGEFSGQIKDNLTNQDRRGRVNLIMNSAGNTQILSGELNYSGKTEIKNGTLALDSRNKLADVVISGGSLKYFGENLKIANLDWSSGGIELDLSKNRAIILEGNASISAMPEALDTFVFSNIVARKSYTLFMFNNKKDAFSNFAGKKLEYKDAADGKVYDGVFGASDTALTVVFIPR